MMRGCLTFVHLSDIHFTGQSGDSCHDLDEDVRHELQRDAASLVQRLGAVTGLLVTGDIGFSGGRDEYVKAAGWLVGLCRDLKCPDENVWVVPGNHDVDRRVVTKSKTTRMAHERLRTVPIDRIDAELRELCEDPAAAGALLDPLREYNEFAARYKCGISPGQPFWEHDLRLPDGTTIRLRGLNSVLVSDSSDEPRKMVLGSAQASVRREAGVEHLTLCHHPPDWLRDHDLMTDQLDAKVRVQLFGHKHSQRVKCIGDSVRLTAGAMHPDRSEREWEPIYNVLQLGRLDDGALAIRAYARKWHRQNCCFVADPDPNTGREYFEKIWRDPGAQAVGQQPSVPTAHRASNPEENSVSASSKNSDTPGSGASGPSPVVIDDPERRLTYRFLTLPFRHQIGIAQSLDLLTDEDRALSDSALFSALFARAAEKRKLEKLWQETEARHGEKTPGGNPFTGR